MFIECYKNNGIPYLRLVRSVRRPSKSDPQKITSYKHTELSIGPLSRFDDGKPDYVKRLKESFKEGRPLIEPLPVKRTVKKYKVFLASSQALLATFYAAKHNSCFSIGVNTPKLRCTLLVL